MQTKKASKTGFKGIGTAVLKVVGTALKAAGIGLSSCSTCQS